MEEIYVELWTLFYCIIFCLGYITYDLVEEYFN